MIVDFICRKLKVGGVLYISYNTQPGWAAMVPMRDLLTEHAEVLGADGAGIVSRIDGALTFADQLMAVNPGYARANPQIAERINKIKEQNRNYVAHEYFNRDWAPMSISKMAVFLEPAKLEYACSAHYLDAIDAINLSTEQQALLNQIPDTIFREAVRDFCVNQQFRRDYWVKGERRLTPLEQAEALRAVRVMLCVPHNSVSLKVTGSLGEATMQESVYQPILDKLADHKPKTLGQLEAELQPQSISFVQLLQATMVLAGTGTLASVQEDSQISKLKKRTDALNLHLLNKARSVGDITALASPVTGGGITVPRFQQLFLLARLQGHKKATELAEFTWNILNAQGQRLIKEGKALDSAEENLAELTTQAEEFLEQRLPVLKALHIG